MVLRSFGLHWGADARGRVVEMGRMGVYMWRGEVDRYRTCFRSGGGWKWWDEMAQ